MFTFYTCRRDLHYQTIVSIGGLIATLGRTLGRGNLPEQKLRNGYLAFDLLLDMKACFKCAICGDRPQAIILDGNMKTLIDIDMSMVDRNVPEGFDGQVPRNELLEVCKHDVLSRALTNDRRVIRPIPIAKSLMYMDPSVGTEIAFNTEHRKYAPLDALLQRLQNAGTVSPQLFDRHDRCAASAGVPDR